MKRKTVIHPLVAGLFATTLVGCGGGGGGGGGPPPGQPGSAGQIQLSATQFTVAEAAGTVTINVTRSGGATGAVGVSVATSDGTATAGQDYAATTSTVSFADGESAQKSVTLNIGNDAADEPDEMFTIVLSNPTGNVTLGTQTTASILITDDDVGPSDPPATAPPTALTAVVLTELKKLSFAWVGGAGATSFRVMAGPDGVAFAQVGADLPPTATQTRVDLATHLFNWVREPGSEIPVLQYRIDACNALGCTPSNVLDVNQVLSESATGYLKASERSASSQLGSAVAVSGDGKTLALGLRGSNGIGAVYVYRYGTTQAGQPALLPIPDRISPPSQSAMHFGYTVALNDNGTILAVGAPTESHNQKGVGAYPAVPNLGADESGAVFIYSRPSVDAPWSPTPVYVKAIDADVGDVFGTSVALSADGTVLVTGAPGQDSPNAVDDVNTVSHSGAAYVTIFTGNQWTMLTGILKATNVGENDDFGASVAIDGDGSVILVGAPEEDSSGVGIDPPDDDAKRNSGAMYYVSIDGVKEHAPELRLARPTRRFKAPNSAADDFYGYAVATSRSGDVVAVGAPGALTNRGLAHIYSGTNNLQDPGLDIATLRPRRLSPAGRYGTSIALSGDGNIVAIGAPQDSNQGGGVDSSSPGVLTGAGAVDVLIRPPGARWSFTALITGDIQYVKSNNTDDEDAFGTSVALSADGRTLLVGAPGEDGNGIGHDANNNPFDESVLDSGAAYLY